MLCEPAQEDPDEPVVARVHRAHDARYDSAVITPGGFIPSLHLPVVTPCPLVPPGRMPERVNYEHLTHSRLEVRASPRGHVASEVPDLYWS